MLSSYIFCQFNIVWPSIYKANDTVLSFQNIDATNATLRESLCPINNAKWVCILSSSQLCRLFSSHEMARKNLKPKLLIIALVLFSLMFQCKAATRFPAAYYHLGDAVGTQKLLDVAGNDDYNFGDQAPPSPDDYDFYRRQGDVPSPGVGH